MSSNIKIINATAADRRILTPVGITGFDDDPADTGGASNPSLIAVAEIAAALRGSNGANGTSVVVSTQSGEVEEGDITFSSPLTYTNTVARTLTLNAARDVNLDADITPSVAAGVLNLAFNAGSSAVNPNTGASDSANAAGNVVMGAGVTIDSNGGTIGFTSASGQRQSLQGTIRSGGGAVSVAQGIDLAGDLSISAGAGGITVGGNIDGARDLVLDAAGAAVQVNGLIGNATRLTGLGVAGTALTMASSTVNVDELAVNLTGGNARVNVVNSGAMRVGTVGSVSGISTNTGNVSLMVSGLLAVDAAIATAGTAAPGDLGIGQGFQTGAVTLSGGSGISLGADIRTDGGAVSLSSPVTLTATIVTIDTDRTAEGNAGNVTFSGGGATINGAAAGQNTLFIDARETGSGSGLGGAVSFGALIGAATRLGALGIAAGGVAFNNGGSANDIGTFAIALTGANQGVSFTDRAGLAIGSVGSLNGIKTNTGNVGVTVLTGDLLVEQAIDTTGTALASGGSTGFVQLLTAGGNLTISDTISGASTGTTVNAVILGASGSTTVNAALTARIGGISISGTGGIALGADLQTDGGSISLTSASRITLPLVTIDTDRTAGGNAGNVSLSTGSSINGTTDGENTLIVDARETSSGGGGGGNVAFGVIGATTRLGALGIGAGTVGFNNSGGANRIDTLAIELTAANCFVSLTTASSLTIGEVGPFSGITTNSGNVVLNVTGNLTVAKAIHAVGPAPAGNNGQGLQAGLVQLVASGNLTISDTITGAATSGGNPGIVLSAAGTATVNAKLTATTGGVQFSSTGGTTRLGADVQIDGGTVSLGSNQAVLTAATVTIDTDQTAGGNAGNVNLGAVNGDGASARTLLIDARETGAGGGAGGTVSISGVIGATTRLGALGIGAGSVSFGPAGHSIETLAVEVTGANRSLGLTAGASLTVGNVGPYSGIKTNSGNVGITVTSGNFTIAEAINTIGTAPAGDTGQGFQSGFVSLNASSGNLTISDTITARGINVTAINLASSGTTTINAALTAVAGGIFVGGSGTTVLGVNLQTDGGFVSLNNAVTLTAPIVTIDTDQTAGGAAGNVAISSQGIKSDATGTRTLIVDARETGNDASGTVSFSGGVGGAGRLAGLGVGAGSVGFNNASGANNIDTFAIELSNANAGFFLLTTGPLKIGSVGPFSGIKTNSGNVVVSVESGTLTVAEAINTTGLGTFGSVQLITNNATLTVSNTITGVGVNLTANGTGTVAVNADINARSGGLTLNAPNGGAIRLGADLQTDGALTTLVGATTLTSATVTLDTDVSLGGNAGNVTVNGTIDDNAANASMLVVDARETGDGTGGIVSFNGLIGSSVRVGALGLLANRVSFAAGANNVGVIAVDLSGPNQSFSYTNADTLTVGTVGPVSGITTDTGNVSVTVNAGTLTVEQAIDTDGDAPPAASQTGAVTLSAAGGVTLSGPAGDVTAAGSFTVNADSDLNAVGAYLQNAGATVSAAGVQITASDVTIADTITSAGNVTLLPSTTSATIGVAASASFALSDAELDLIATAATLVIGSSQNTGGISIASTEALSQDKNLRFTTGGTVTLGSNNLQTSGTVTFLANRVNGGTGMVIAPTLTATTATGLTLNTDVDTLSLINTAGGSVVVTSTGAVTVSGANSLGAFNITAGGALVTGGTISALSGRLAGTSVTLNNAVTATSQLELVTAGGISQTAALSVGTLIGSSTGATTLANLANAIGTLGAFTANGLTVVDAAGGLTIGGAVNAGTGAASITTTGDLFVNAAVDGSGVSLQANGGTIRLGAAVNAHAGAASLQSPVVLTADAAVSGGSVTFAGSIGGGFALATTGNTTFGGAVGAGVTLAALTVNGSAAINGGAVATTGAQTYNGSVSLGANTTFTGTAATFASGVSGNGFDLALNFSVTTALNAGFAGIRNLATGNGGTTELSGTITTTGTQTYGDAVKLTAATVLTSSGAGANGNVTFAAVDAAAEGAQSLTVNSAGTTIFGGAVGATALQSLTTDAAGTTAINGGSITTTGAQTYNDAVTLGADAMLTSSGLGNITFGGAVNGAHALNIVTGGTTTLNGIGTLTALASLTTDSNGSTVINGGMVNTTGAQSYNDAVTINGDTMLASTNGPIAFAGTLQIDGQLTMSTAGSATFHGVVSGAGALMQNGAGITTLLADNLYTGATTVNAGTLLVNGSIAAASAITVNSGATLGGTGNVGAVTVVNGGFLAPGASPGTLHTGNLLLTPGATLKIEIGSATFDQVDVLGSVTLTNALLSTTLLASFVPAVGASFTIINNDGADAIVGTFAGLGDDTIFSVGGNAFRISYHGGSDSNDVTLTALNDAPVLTGVSPVFPTITEDNTANTGQLVSDFRGSVTDADGTTAFGIAITAANPGNGHWQYQLDGTTTWTGFGTVDDAHALLLRDNDRVRFLPNGENGTSATFGYRAWDQSAGAAGSTADATTFGGITAFSTAQDSASLTVTSVNDAPFVVTNTALSLAEGASGAITATKLAFADVDTGAGAPIYTVTTLAAHGTVLKSGAALGLGGTFTQLDIDAGAITYQHDGSETPADTFGFSVGDGTASVPNQTFTFNLTPVDDPTVVAHQIPDQASPEDTLWSFTFAADAFDDPDGDTLTYAATLAGGAALPGWLQFDPAQRKFSGTPPLNFNGSLELTVTATGAGAPVSDTFALTITPVNDAPVLAANTGATLAEGATTTITAAQLAFTDVDAGAVTTYTLNSLATNGKLFKNGTALLLNDTFTQQDVGAGAITYTHDGSDTTAASFGFSVGDGTATIAGQTFAFTVTPVNDAPVSQDIVAGGDEDSIITGSLSADDSDSASLTYSLVTQAGHGTVTVNPDGSFSYRPVANYNGLDQFTFRVNDGTANSDAGTVDLVVNPVNDGPVNTVPGTQVLGTQTSATIAGLSISDLDAGAGAITTTLAVEHGTLNAAAGGATLSGGGTDRMTLTGTLAAVNAALAGLVYAPDHGFFGTDTLTMTTSDAGNTGAGGALTDSDKVLIQVGHELAGSPGSDNFAVSTGTSSIDAGTGVDSVTFDFKLNDATITWSGNAVIIDTANSHTVLTGVETYVFRDGTANNNDGDVLVDDLFYYSRNQDVWKAHVDADQHYHSFGWQEWRDPNAFFSTSFYLAVNQDVKGVDPLQHFDTIGWTQGRQPGPDFDTAAYLKANPDIAAAHVDPLAHFLANGAQEGRQPSELLTLATSKGFDYVYYLAHNPDVAAAHVDPLQHFNTIGWKEGRDPNAFFDTSGYLATYADVKASGANPLEHYNQFGWKEGRDPSPDFDTSSYLDAYADVAWGNTNPLAHYLQFGIHEGRHTFADGVWG